MRHSKWVFLIITSEKLQRELEDISHEGDFGIKVHINDLLQDDKL